MRVYWMLRDGESIEIYDGEGFNKEKLIAYRVGVERFFQAEVKLVRPNSKTKILSPKGHSRVLDVATNGALYLEVTGKDGCAFGWYEGLVSF